MATYFKTLSLFDGMACGRLALSRAKFQNIIYFASEIDDAAIKIAKSNYPDIIHVGDIRKLRGSDFPKIELLLGGSPCQDFSKAKHNGLGPLGNKSSLVWEFIRLFNEVKHKWFLFENVPMKKEWSNIISKELGREPIEIDSSLVSAQNRKRFYWTNIPNIGQPDDCGLTIRNIIYDDGYKVFTDKRIARTKKRCKNYVKWDSSGKGYFPMSQRAYYKDRKFGTLSTSTGLIKILMDYENNVCRYIHPVEAERAQTLPDNYTNVVCNSQRFKAIGNGWTVDVIKHLLQNLRGRVVA